MKNGRMLGQSGRFSKVGPVIRVASILHRWHDDRSGPTGPV
jgi:hypothetical protein